ncbi:MAG: hypothetical protein KI786_13320, partial [Mameliella sp.]|nr:hypothetical protein [Phaeodactylibacter sp.]
MYYKTTLLIWCCILLSATMGWSQLSTVAISEVNSNDQVELINTGAETVNVSSLWLCDFPAYAQVGNLTIVCGDINLAPGDVIVVSGWTVNEDDAELGIYLSAAFSSPTAITDYVEWGSSNHQRSGVAVAAGIWGQGDFVPAFQSDESLLHDGSGNSPDTWMSGVSSLCSPNGGNCDANGGTLSGGPYTFCVEDGEADNIPAGDIQLTGNTGTNSAWVVTDDAGNILGLPPMPSAVNFDDAPAGICLVWHLSYEDGLTGLEVGQNASDLDGCFSLSNSVTVNRATPMGGTLTGGPFTFCVGDGEVDNIPAGAITLEGNSGANSTWVVTDDAGNILGLPPMPSAVNFDDAPAGICLVWHLSYEDGLTGLEVGQNAADLGGCFSLSNSITVNRIEPQGGTLTGGPFTFCVGDGEADNIPAGAITLDGNSGANSTWVVTDDAGNILGLPPMPSAVNFDDAPAGICLVWHL